MTKVIKEYKKIEPEESLALIKDKETNKRNWRYRFVKKLNNRSAGKQFFRDYPHKKFDTLMEFKTFIEDLPEDKRYKE